MPVICQLTHTLSTGGAEVLARQFAVQAPGDFRFVFICLDECGKIGEQLREEGYPVEVLDRRPGFDLGCAWRLGRLIKKYNIRLVHAHQYGPFFYTALARRMARFLPILFEEHGRGYPDYRRPKRVLANRILLNRRDRVVAVGRCVRQALIDHEGIAPDRIEVIYNGVDLGKYAAALDQRDAVRADLGVADHDLLVLQVARLDGLKDHATAVRAAASAVRQGVPLQLQLAGEGPERAPLERLVDDLGINSHVHFLGLRDDVPRLLAAADVFLLTSLTEGIPLTLIEAMAARLPCVATRVGGTPEVIVDGATGLLAEAADPESVARCLVSLAHDEMHRQAMGEAGQRRAFELFDEQAMHATYDTVYREMLGLGASCHTSQHGLSMAEKTSSNV